MAKKKQVIRPTSVPVVNSGEISGDPIEKLRDLVNNLLLNSGATAKIGDVKANEIPADALKLPPLAMPGALEILKERLKAFNEGSMDEDSQVIKRKDFVAQMIERGYLPKERSYDTNERYLRLAISRIRTTDGEWILSTGGSHGGYWMVDDPQKAEAYLNTEVLPRIEELVKIVKSFSGPRRTKEWKQELMILG